MHRSPWMARRRGHRRGRSAERPQGGSLRSSADRHPVVIHGGAAPRESADPGDERSGSREAPEQDPRLRCRRRGQAPRRTSPMMDHPTRRGNYDSGQDYVLEYGDLRFTFNERDFSERVEQAGHKLGFVAGRLEQTELEDLVNLTVNGEVQDPASGLGEHVNDCWPELVGPAERSLVHWLRRLVFRSAWLDQRVKEGELDVVFDDLTQSFGYVQPERDREPIELSPEPNWGRVAYQPR